MDWGNDEQLQHVVHSRRESFGHLTGAACPVPLCSTLNDGVGILRAASLDLQEKGLLWGENGRMQRRVSV
jgi:hypothetical protein